MSLLLDFTVIASIYFLISASFSFERVAFGYLNFGYGDLAIFSFCASQFLVEVLFGDTYFIIHFFVLIAVYISIRLIIDKYIYSDRLGKNLDIILKGMGIALIFASLTEDFFDQYLWKVLKIKSKLQFLSSYDITQADFQIVFAAILTLIMIIFYRSRKSGTNYIFLRSNRVWSLALDLIKEQQLKRLKLLSCLFTGITIIVFNLKDLLSPEMGLNITIYGFVISTAGRYSTRWALIVSSIIAAIEVGVVHFTYLSVHWVPHLTLIIILVLTIVKRGSFATLKIDLLK